MMLEATCGRCGETFIPESEQPDDLIHGVTELGDECGGTGIVDGAWIAPGELVRRRDLSVGMTVECPLRSPDGAHNAVVRGRTDTSATGSVMTLSCGHAVSMDDRHGLFAAPLLGGVACTAFGRGCGGTVVDGTCGTCGARSSVLPDPARTIVTIRVSGKAMSTITGSDLYQRPETYTSPTDPDHAAAVRAGIALNAAHGRPAGKGWTYVVELDVAAAEIVRDYCTTVGETFASESEPETRADGRALLVVAERIADITRGVTA
jgi:hypothetical protein